MFGNRGKNNSALDWLLAFKAEKSNFWKIGGYLKGKLIGMQTSAGKEVEHV